MSKNLNVNLTFTANTQQAKMQIKDLQTSLNSITSGVTSKVGLGETITQDLQKANQAAMQLKVALRSATDVKTGNIDLYKLDQIFKANKMSVEQYRVALQGAGAEGQRAFAQLNQAITNAQMPIRKTSTMIDSMWTTMKNTMRWQLTSSMLMGFTSAVRKAYGYAQDLNESLNNIRIVTGYNTDKMDKFAISANKAAKALNTTTTAYTDAALIYYQQGLSDEEVLKRTNVTVKLANVSRESAETVSEWMTSIWNNFDDGTKTLEHYADVMTALGAATASSSDEIATGIEKFSAVAKNVGLSYEYAASALATVTAQTRQSADVVGTAFKTLFTRITDLELGKGLDDGTTLGQYSQTLSDIGVNIKTSTGELRDMDAILNDLGARWDNLNKATQQAVAQSVAGIRQSNQFIALMDNWDFFQQNLQTSLNSQGALQEQADIYGESWEAASKRVSAAAEGLYDSILDDDFFIEITNGFADLIEFVEMAVDAMGGLKGLLPGILALMLQLFGNKMLVSVREFSSGLKASGAAAEKVALGLKADSAQAAKNMTSGIGGTAESVTLGENMVQQGKIQERVWSLNKNLSETEKIRLQNLERLNEEQRELTLELSKQQDSLEAQTNEYKKQVQERQQNLNDADQLVLQAQGKRGASKARLAKAKKGIEALGNQNVFSKRNLDNDLQRTDFSGLYNSAKSLDLKNNNDVATKAVKTYINALQDYNKCQQNVISTEQQRDQAQDRLKQSQDELTAAQRKHTEAEKNVVEQSKIQEQSYKNTMTYLDQLENSVDWGQSVVSLATGFSQLAMGISSLQSLGSIWENSDLSTGEKLLQTVMSLGMGISTLMFGWKQIHSVVNADNIVLGINTLARIVNASAMSKQAKNNQELARSIKIENTELDKNTGKQIINKATRKSKDGNTTYTRFLDKYGNVRFRSQKKGTAGGPISTEEGEAIFGKGSGQKDWQTKGLKWKEAGKGLTQFLPALAGIAVATAAVTAAIVLISKSLNKEEDALKAATESAKRFREEHQKVSDETQKLKDNLTNYKEATSGLNELTKGTVEYREALLKANEQALELIKNNKDLEYQVIDGQIVINQASMDRAYNNQLQKQEDALMASSVASQTANAARITNNNAEFAKDMKTSSDVGQYAANTGGSTIAMGAGGAALGTGVGITGAMLTGMSLGAAAGSAAAGIGAIVGVIVGAIAGIAYGLISTATEGVAAEKEKEAVQRLQELSRDNPDILKSEKSVRNALEKEGIGEDIIEALTEDMDTLRELIASNEALRQQNIALNSTIAQAIAKERGDEEYSQAITSYMNNRTVEDKDYDSDWETVRKSIDEEDGHLQDLYEIFYDKDTEGYLTGMAGNNVTRVTYDEDGREVETEVSQETISSELTSKIKKAALEGDTATLKKVLELIKDSGSGTEVKDIIDKYTIDADDLDAVVSRAESNAAKLVNSGFDKEDDKNIINMLTGQLEGDLEEIDFSSLTREQLELIKQNQELWKDNSELNEKIQKGIDENEYEAKRTEKNLNASIEFDIQQNESNELDKLLSKTKTTAAEFKTYQKIIQNEYKISESNAYGLAKANLMVQSSITDLNKKITDNSEILNKNNKNNAQYAKAVAEISTAMTSWLGVELDSDFVEEHMEKIKAAAEGDKQAIKELQDLASQEFVINLDLQGEYENQLLDFTNTVNSTELTIGMTLDTTEATKNLGEFVNKMIRMGQMTTEQGVAYLQSMGFEVDENDMSETALSTSELWKSNATLWEKIKGTFTGKSVKTINMSSVQYTGEGKTADLSEITEKEEKKNRSNKKKYQDEIDRYHEVKEVMSDLERQAERLAKSKERAFGADKLALMDKEIAKQKELWQTEKDYLSEIDSYYAKDRTNLLSKYAVNLDETGRITNYEEVYKQQIDRLNSIGKANNWEGDAYEKQKEAYEQFKKDIQQYEKTLNLLEEQQQAVIDKQHELADLALEKIEFTVQLQVDMAEDDAAYIDFLMQKIEDDAFSAAEAIGLLGQQAETVKSKIEAAEQGIADIMADVNEQGFMTEDQAEALRGYRDDLIDANAELLEIRNTVQEKLTDAYDAWNEKLDKNAAKIEHLTSVTNSYKNIIDIVGKDTLGISDEAMAKLTDTQVNNANNALKASKAKLEANEAFLKDLQQKRADAVAKYGEDSDEVADWDKQIEYAEEQVMSAKEDFMSNWENALTAAADAFASHVDTIVENFSEAMGGAYKNLEQLQEAFDRQVEVNDRYLQQYEKTYEINKLNRSIQDSIDKTDNVASQKELRKLQQELLVMQKDGVNVSQRDIEYMQKKYDLMVAEQALKDAQNAKSVVRLTRDSEGNFGYTYTADQDTVDNAQQNYEDKLYAMQQFGDESLQEIQEQILATNTEFKEALQAIADDSTLSLEEKKVKAAEITEYYTGKLNYWTGEAQKFMQHGQEMNTEYNAGMAQNFNETLLGSMYPDLTTFEGYYTQGMEAMTGAGSAFTEALEGYQGRIDTAFSLAGENAQTFAEDVAGEGGYLDQVQEESNETAEEAESLKDDMIEALGNATDSVEDFYNNYASYMDQVRQETEDTIQKVNELIQKYAELANADTGSSGNSGSGGGDKSGSGSGGGGSGGGSGSGSGGSGGGGSGSGGNYTALETKKIADRVYAKGSSGNNWYSKGTATDQEWADFQAGKPMDITKLRKYDNEKVDKLAKIWKSISDDKGAELTKDTIYYTDYQQSKGGLTGTKGKFNDDWYGVHPDVTFEDIIYQWKDDFGYWVKVKVNGDARGGVKQGNKYWVPLCNVNKGGTKDYYNSSQFDTGGYTGTWGPEGRLAMLHQKEIVLNAHDTENFLAAIGIVRDISDQIEKNAIVMQYQNQLANYRASVGNSGETLQQEVHITAEFPNATDHNEIEEAFKNLTNLASQYANRKF